MREAINNNPVVQAALLGALLIVGAFFFLSTTGGGGEKGSPATETQAVVTVAGSGETGTATGSTPGEAVEGAIAEATEGSGGAAPSTVPMDAPPPPAPVRTAFDADKTIALLFVRDGGIDDAKVKSAMADAEALPGVATFVVPAGQISRYAAITQGVAVDRVPALVVIRPKNLDGDVPVASVQYGFQSSQSVTQAVIDAGYQGRTLDYHP